MERRVRQPGNEIYGEWNTVNPNAYGPELSAKDTVLQLQLTDLNAYCGFSMPVPPVVTSRFGWRKGRAHNGVDLDLEVWDTVCSAFPGVVRFAAPFGGFGRLVVVRHYNGFETFYAHLHRITVKEGDEVDEGQLVGLGGSSGHSTGRHLHFETRFKGIPIDPAHIIDLVNGELLCDTLVLKRTRSSFAAYPKGTRFHTVVKGEHLSTIANEYGVPLDILCTLNGLCSGLPLTSGPKVDGSSDRPNRTIRSGSAQGRSRFFDLLPECRVRGASGHQVVRYSSQTGYPVRILRSNNALEGWSDHR
ncbi:MAG: peptidoglycan DD-metalloendopeptidase family protein [Flavobacteriales bacterium]|nr:peptidoglycan DD-metalloendopeptidase family protein [Flavobacteriales bacterium]